jgi:hypothetical protein
MMNADPVRQDGEAAKPEAALDGILRAGPKGAIVLAGIAAVAVMLMWFAFYLLVFVPRAGAP